MKVEIRLKRRHPFGAMPFGKHVITNELQVIELDDSERADLKNEGPISWFEFKELKAEPVKKKVTKKVTKKKVIKKAKAE